VINLTGNTVTNDSVVLVLASAISARTFGIAEPKVSTTTFKPEATELAVERTWLAYERTLMAWVRTATSMISFGFSIYKFFQFEKAEGVRPAGLPTRFFHFSGEYCPGLAFSSRNRPSEGIEATDAISFSASSFASRVFGRTNFDIRTRRADHRGLARLRLLV
jgi:uncharacterized membrane protein YidH (DUF202 family)